MSCPTMEQIAAAHGLPLPHVAKTVHTGLIAVHCVNLLSLSEPDCILYLYH